MTGTLTGTGTLVRFVLRRDRVRIPVWTLAIVGALLSSVASVADLFPEPGDLQNRADLLDNPAMVALSGPGYGADDYTYGAMIATEYLSFTAVFIAIMSVLLVTRHTRAEEESGSAELVRATAVGRHAMTTATLVVVGATNLVIGGLVAVGLPLVLDELSFGSSVLFGASLAAVGLAFAGIAAFTAQLTEYPRAANGMAMAALGIVYVLRAVGDIGNGVLSWLSPIGWSQATKVYVADRWWPLLLSVGLAVGATAGAFALSSRRDLGGGILAQKPGRATASAGLLRPLGFALRLQRAGLIAWGVGLLMTGLVYGSLAESMEEFAEDSDFVQDVLDEAPGESVTDQFFATFLIFFALLATGFALLAALRLRSEENAGRAEPLLATALDRWRWTGSHLTIALVGTVVMLALGGLGLGVAAAVTLDDFDQFPRLFGAALAHVPAVWVTVGLAVALFGIVPRAALWVWALLAYGAFVSMYGPLLNVPDWLNNLSPFGHTPQVPAESLDLVPLAVLTAVAAGSTWAGLYGFRRRDVQMS